MTITKPQVEQILKTLPIGYYIKRDVKVKLTDEDSSYYDMMKDEISISYPMIKNVCQSLPENGNLENDVRCLLYHETSHAFITPKNLLQYSAYPDILNIFEDERIESICRNFYLNVNFREFVKRVNNFQGEKPSSAKNLFYQIVRYRKGPQQFVERVSSIILNHQTFNTNYEIVEYRDDVIAFWIDVKNYFNEQERQKQQQSQNGQSEQNSQSQMSNENQIENTQNENSTIQNEQVNQAGQADNDIDESDIDKENIQSDACKDIITRRISKYDSLEIQDEVEKLLSSVKNVEKSTSSAINAYSGVFNPRSVARDDYKYFVQQNRVGHVKAYSAIHLNLFIDCSGSFRSNDTTVNKLLKALLKFEKSNKNFTFDLISCGIGQKIRDRNDRVQHSGGGTGINFDIIKQFKQVQVSNAQNINIVLYDGDACEHYSGSDRKFYGQSFKAFDNKNCVVIVDDLNAKYMHHCKSAKVIITNDYVHELQKNVLLALRTLCR